MKPSDDGHFMIVGAIALVSVVIQMGFWVLVIWALLRYIGVIG